MKPTQLLAVILLVNGVALGLSASFWGPRTVTLVLLGTGLAAGACAAPHATALQAVLAGWLPLGGLAATFVFC